MMRKINFNCPVSTQNNSMVMLSHGNGGKAMHELIDQIFLSQFNNEILNKRLDSSVLKMNKGRIAFTSDSFVVDPIFFPGGDIGSLSVYGTVNDLAASGASPKYLSASFIIEEGFSLESLKTIVKSMKKAADESGVLIVTGDTKVVNKGKTDGIFINTTGIGIIQHNQVIAPQSIKEGDAVILNGDIARHGMAIMTKREGLNFESGITSDCCSLSGLVDILLKNKIQIHCLRDLTRGGLATSLNEIAKLTKHDIEIIKKSMPLQRNVSCACEILGIDPIYVACEGRMVMFIPKNHEKKVINLLRKHKKGKNARIIGYVGKKDKGVVTMKNELGVRKIVDMLIHDQLPRIC